MNRFALALLLVACGSGDPHVTGDAASGSGGSSSAGGAPVAGGGGSVNDDPDPTIEEAELSLLRGMSPASLPPAPVDVTNAWADDPAAAGFGQTLFFDGGFSGTLLDGDNDGTPAALGMKGESGKVSCAGCHVPKEGFSDARSLGKQVSLGSGWGLRRAPSLLDVAQSKLLMWDGARDSLFSQSFGVLESQVEMNSSRLYGAQQIYQRHREPYEALFGPLPPLDDTTRFPPLLATETGCRQLGKDHECIGRVRGAPGDDAEFDGMSAEDRDAVTRVWVNVGKALGAYQRLLTCGQSPFDAWMQGEEGAISRAAQRGAGLFVGRAGCVRCHSGPYFSDEQFHNVGLLPTIVAVVFIDANDRGASEGLQQLQADPLNSLGSFSDGQDGRVPESVTESHLGAFRTPRLRCAAQRPSFMHTAQLRSLEQVVAFFNRGGDRAGFPGKSELAPLNLSAREQADLVAFLESLSGPGPDSALLAPP